MADWQEGAHACIIAVVFAFMLAKLLSLLTAFKSERLRVQRSPSSTHKEATLLTGAQLGSTEHTVLYEDLDFSDVDPAVEADDDDNGEDSDSLDFKNNPGFSLETVSVEDGGGKVVALDVDSKNGNSLPEESNSGERGHISEEEKAARKAEGFVEYDSDDWEGVESTELEEEFVAASTFVATMASRSGFKASQDLQLQLYGLYKVATEGPCRTPQPSLIHIPARAKWNAWQKLGNTSPEEAMVCYIDLVSRIRPDWNRGTDKCQDKQDDGSLPQLSGSSAKHSGVGGPVFSTLVSEEGSGEAGSMEAIHACAKNGDNEGLLRLLEEGEKVDRTDSQGRTALHWAVDRGHLTTVQFLLSKGAEIHAKDQEGQTALHYATVCEHENVARHLVDMGADTFAVDNDGVTPNRLRPTQWCWMAVTRGS